LRHEARTALYCHEYLHKKFAPNRFDLTLQTKEDPIADEYKKMGDLHEAHVIAYIKESSIKWVQIDPLASYEIQEIDTAKALLRLDLDVILGAHISGVCEAELKKSIGDRCKGDEERVSRPDLLVKVGEDWGIPIWAPVDIKSHKAFDVTNKSNQVELVDLATLQPVGKVAGRIEKTDALQLAHYMFHLRELGLAPADSKAGIIGSDGEQIAWTNLDQTKFGQGKMAPDALTIYKDDFMKAKEIISQSLIQAKDDTAAVNALAMVQPDGVYGCKSCEYKDVCLKEMNEFKNHEGHPTLLATVTPNALSKIPSTIESITDLRQASGLTDFAAKAQIRARVWQTKKPELLDPTKHLDLPEFDIEIDIDLENSQAALQEIDPGQSAGRDQVYLYGYGIHDRSKDQDWRTATIDSFGNYADTEEAEYEVLLSMWQLLQHEVAKAERANQSVGIFHYSHHEKIWWRNFARRHGGKQGVPTQDEVEVFMAKYFVDLRPFAEKISFPTMSYSIKALAPSTGFSWAAEDAGGAMSLLKYKTATASDVEENTKQEAINWLRAYNLDDIRATFALREYIRSLVASWSGQ
jgi:predicted RecB family nuclease